MVVPPLAVRLQVVDLEVLAGRRLDAELAALDAVTPAEALVDQGEHRWRVVASAQAPAVAAAPAQRVRARHVYSLPTGSTAGSSRRSSSRRSATSSSARARRLSDTIRSNADTSRAPSWERR